MLECVVNISEGRRDPVIDAVAGAAGSALLDVHRDPDHNRSVLTLLGEDAARAVAVPAAEELDLTGHEGAHPRIGAIDVVPFVPLAGATMDEAVRARDRFASWAADTLGLPCFTYGPDRSLPTVRRGAFSSLEPDTGPRDPHPRLGAVAVGARPVLVAYNLWLADPDLARAQRIATSLRSDQVRTLGLLVGDHAQVSCNLVSPVEVGPADVYDAVAAQAPVARAELVGLVPAGVLSATPERRWTELDLARDRTIEARIAARR